MSEHHPAYNRGWFFPVAIVRLYEDGEINGEEFILLGIINSLCHYEKGCYATNRYLAERWGNKTATWVSKAISKLEGLRLLRVEEQSLSKSRRIWVTFMGDELYPPERSNPSRKVQGSEVTPLQKSATHPCRKVQTEYSEKNKEEHCDRSRAHHDRPSGFVPEDELQDKFIVKSCHNLENFLRSKHRINPKHHNKERWYEQMRLLLQDIRGDRERLRRVLDTYIEEEHTDYTPVADSARSFRKKFISIERWANKVKPEDNRSQYREEVVG
jgi:hypothetical protein